MRLKLGFNRELLEYYPDLSPDLEVSVDMNSASDSVWLDFDREEFLQRSEELQEFWKRAGNERNSHVLLNGREIPYREFFSAATVVQCNKEFRTSSSDYKTHCFDADGREGWGCKYLRSIYRYLPPYQRRDLINSWFLYGDFTTEDAWNVDRKGILRELNVEADNKFLDCCEIFSREKIEKMVESLPQKIDPATDGTWEIIYYEDETGKRTPSRLMPRYWGNEGSELHPLTVKRSMELEKTKSYPSKRVRVLRDTDARNVVNSKNSVSGQKRDLDQPQAESPNGKRNIPETSFSDIGGIDAIIKQVREVVELPLARPNLFRHFGIKPHHGILLYGPPGCGKTMIARAIASEVRGHFISVNGPELLSKWYGQSEENLRELFYEARELTPSIIFFDEFDSICQKRSSTDSGYEAKLVNQLLTLMDGVEDYSRITVIAATNRKDILDPAVMRPGRFDYSIEVPPPDDRGIRKILEISVRNMPLDSNTDLDKIASMMAGFSGADIAFSAREAAYNSMRRNVNFSSALQDADSDFYDYLVSEDDFLLAVNKASLQRSS